MTDTRWKQCERRLATALGTRRIPVTGKRADPDFETDRFAYQAKKGRRFPAYLARWLREIRQTAAREGKVGVVIWQERGSPDDEAAVVLRFADWVQLHTGAERPAAKMASYASATLPAASICARAGCVDGLFSLRHAGTAALSDSAQRTAGGLHGARATEVCVGPEIAARVRPYESVCPTSKPIRTSHRSLA